MSTDPIPFDDALKRALDDGGAPPLSADFADRVVKATEGRAAPLPRSRPAPAKRWRSSRRLVIGVVAAGALATTAAATGLLEELGVDLPSPQEVWNAVRGNAPAPEPERATEPAPLAEPESSDYVVIDGPIDTPEELEEAFRRVEDARTNRREDRRERIDGRIDAAIERRREQGLPAPTPEQEERLRGRIDRFRERADEGREARDEELREQLRQKLEEDGVVTREDAIQNMRDNRPVEPFLRDLSPEERRERVREWRERRQDRLRSRLPAETVPETPEPGPETPLDQPPE